MRTISIALLLSFAAPLAAADEKPKFAIHVGKAITSAGPAIENVTILVADGKIQAIGPRDKIAVPAGYEVIDHGNRWAMPRLIDAHSHIGGTGDINEMVYQTNSELRVLDVIRPNNDQLKNAVAGGVTTITFIPGSGTNMGGWGALMKTGPGKLEDVLVRFPGVLKIAQAGNPERRGGEVGSGRMGMNHVIREQLREGMGYVKDWDVYEVGKRKDKPALNLRLEYFKPLFRRQIPVVVHTQGYQVIMSTLRILHDEMNLKVVIDQKPIEVQVQRISPGLEKQNLSLVIEADIPNAGHKLRAGHFAEADITVDRGATALALPDSAVFEFAGVEKVWLVTDGRAREQRVHTGR